jgi:hypothetical protein
VDEQGPLGAGPGSDDEPAGEQNGTGSRDRPAAFYGSGGDPLAPPPVETTPGSSSSGREQQQPTTPPVVGEGTDQEGQGKAAEDQKVTEEKASAPKQQEQTSTPPAQEKEGETVDQKQNAQEEDMKGKASEGQNKEDEERISSIPENLQKKDDFNEEDGLKDPGIRLCDITPTECHYEYPDYCKYPSFAYDPACDKYNDHDYDPDFGKDWYKPHYWKAVVVHDCYCWGDYFKPWHYWNHWDYYWDSYWNYYYWDYYWDSYWNYYYWDYYWDYECGCWAYDYQPWYYWYSPATIYHSFYGYCYYYVAYFKVFAKDKKPTASGKMYDPGSKQTSTVDTQSSAV